MKRFSIQNRGDVTEVVIYGDIGEGWFGGISSQEVKAAVAGITSKDIDLRLNTPGGSIDEGFAIANILREHPATVTAHVDSLAASIGSYIAVWGADEVVMASNARMMIHNAWTVAGGDSHEFRKVADVLEMHNELLIDAYAAKVGGKATREELTAMMDAETWFNAESAVATGLADSIGESALQTAAWFQPGRFRNAPEDLITDKPETTDAPNWKREAARRRLALTKGGRKGHN